jgi:hypothetical protein
LRGGCFRAKKKELAAQTCVKGSRRADSPLPGTWTNGNETGSLDDGAFPLRARQPLRPREVTTPGVDLDSLSEAQLELLYAGLVRLASMDEAVLAARWLSRCWPAKSSARADNGFSRESGRGQAPSRLVPSVYVPPRDAPHTRTYSRFAHHTSLDRMNKGIDV